MADPAKAFPQGKGPNHAVRAPVYFRRYGGGGGRTLPEGRWYMR